MHVPPPHASPYDATVRLDAGENVGAQEVLQSSDYTSLIAWPVRLAIRTGRVPVWVGLMAAALEIAAGVALLRRGRAG